MNVRFGYGIDAHRFASGDDRNRPLVLLGVRLPGTRSLAGTSDADVGAHAVADALLGAAALGDLGEHFPSSDSRWQDADSMGILAAVAGMVREAGYGICNVDVTVVAESVRVSPHRESMRAGLAEVLGIAIDAVSVKATSTDGLGFVGRDEGVVAIAVAGLM